MINCFQIPMIMSWYTISYCDQQKRAWIWNNYCSPLVNDEAPWFLHDYAYVDVILMTCKSGMTIAFKIRYVIEKKWNLNALILHEKGGCPKKAFETQGLIAGKHICQHGILVPG